MFQLNQYFLKKLMYLLNLKMHLNHLNHLFLRLQKYLRYPQNHLMPNYLKYLLYHLLQNYQLLLKNRYLNLILMYRLFQLIHLNLKNLKFLKICLNQIDHQFLRYL